MKFQKSIELWGKENEIRAGGLNLQIGQHVTCGGTPGRFGGTDGLTIRVFYVQSQFVRVRKDLKRHSGQKSA